MAKLVVNEIGVKGLQCPYCLTIVQALPENARVEVGLARHLAVVHPERV